MGVEMENQQDAGQGEQTEEHFADRDAVPVDQWLEEGGKEAHQGETDNPHRDVRGFDASEKEDPVAA